MPCQPQVELASRMCRHDYHACMRPLLDDDPLEEVWAAARHVVIAAVAAAAVYRAFSIWLAVGYDVVENYAFA